MFKVIGVEKREGTYHDKPYTNYRIYAANDRKAEVGLCIDTFKFSRKAYENLLFNHKLESLKDFTFDEVYFDVYRNPIDLVKYETK